VAESRALYLFGLFAVLGELTCLATALLALPALLQILGQGRVPDPAPAASSERS
jgi:hypothetical protein